MIVLKSAIGPSASFARKILSSHPAVTRIVGDRLDCAAVLSGRSVWPNTGVERITEMQPASAAVKVFTLRTCLLAPHSTRLTDTLLQQGTCVSKLDLTEGVDNVGRTGMRLVLHLAPFFRFI